MLKIDNLSFRYPGRRQNVIDDFRLTIDRGGIYGLLGSNGAGKTTLLYLISGLLTPLEGKVEYNGNDTRLRLPKTLSDIFIVPEELTLPAISLDTYIKYNAPFYPRFSREDLDRHIETFGIGKLRHEKLTSLSMGQRKKVFMCFALACNTSLLLMDEPTNGLDIPSKAAFRRFIATSASDDKIIIISTHQVRDIETLLDHVLIMDSQRLLLDSSIAEITGKLAFITTSDRSLIDKALVSQPSVGGTQIVIANDGDLDTEVNLESLFELATTRQDIVDRMFNASNTER